MLGGATGIGMIGWNQMREDRQSVRVTHQKGWTVEGHYKIPSDLQYAEMGRWRRLMGMKQILVMMVVVWHGRS